jgi:hypothetical protein
MSDENISETEGESTEQETAPGHEDEWEPAPLIEQPPGELQKETTQRVLQFHVAMFVTLAASITLVFVLGQVGFSDDGGSSGFAIDFAPDVLLLGYTNAITLSPFLGVLTGFMTARTLEEASGDIAWVAAFGSFAGYMAMLAVFIAVGILVGGQASDFSDLVITDPLAFAITGSGVLVASVGAALSTELLLEPDEFDGGDES